MKNPWIGAKEPWQCKIRHRYRRSLNGDERCTRPGCLAVRPPKHDVAPVVVQLPGEDYWVKCWRWDNTLLYEGPIPVPEHVEQLSPEDRRARRFNRYEVTIVDLEQDGRASA